MLTVRHLKAMIHNLDDDTPVLYADETGLTYPVPVEHIMPVETEDDASYTGFPLHTLVLGPFA